MLKRKKLLLLRVLVEFLDVLVDEVFLTSRFSLLQFFLHIVIQSVVYFGPLQFWRCVLREGAFDREVPIVFFCLNYQLPDLNLAILNWGVAHHEYCVLSKHIKKACRICITY